MCTRLLRSTSREIIITDRLRDGTKWQNFRHHPPSRIIAPEDLTAWLASKPKLDAIVHMGAISATTARDGDLVWHSNVAFSQRLWAWCAANGVRLIYASFAATYGDGLQGFDDDEGTAALSRLRPLNLYGWSKQAFDLWAANEIEAGRPRPPQWVGLKFFNVYGPNEYHKGSMISVVKVKHDEAVVGNPVRLFKSDRPDIANGDQRRDFIWVGDVVDAILFLLNTPHVNGLFNLGTGIARTYSDLARAVCAANAVPQAEIEQRIQYIDMPASLQGQYQSYTEARMDRLRAAGFNNAPTSLEEGVTKYIQEFLRKPDIYL